MKKLFVFVVVCVWLWPLMGQVVVTNGPIVPQLRNGAVAWGDYDGDNDPDLFLSGQDSLGTYRTFLLKNTGTALVPDLLQPLAQVAQGDAAWGDLDGDGDQDLIITGQTANRQSLTQVYQNNGGSLAAFATPSLPGLLGGRVLWADLDNDGDQDLLLTGYNELQGFVGMIGRNDGLGVFSAVTNPLFATRDWSTVGIGDYDADGLPDLAFGDTSPLQSEGIRTEVLHNAGGLTFTAVPHFLPQIYEGGLDFGDADNDGDLDILCMGMGYKPFTEVYAFQAGQFQAMGSALEEMGHGEARWADFTGDGHLDLLVAGYNASGPQARAYRWSPGGYVLVQGPGNMPQLYHARIDWADWNGDGHADFVILGQDALDRPGCYIGTYNISSESFDF